MQIHIENYRSISNLDYDLPEGKVSFLFGVCGSGKSSIISALTNNPSPIDTPAGDSDARPLVTIDGSAKILPNARVYDLEQQNVLFAKGSQQGTYDVFIGDESALIALENEFDDAVASLKANVEKLYAFQGRIAELQKAFGKTGKGNKFTSASKISKVSTAAQKATPFVRDAIEKGGLEYANWIDTGIDIVPDFSKGFCPFCGASLDMDCQEAIGRIRELKLNDLKPLLSSSTLLTDFGIDQFELSSEESAERVKERIANLYSISAEVSKVLAFCSIPKRALLERELPSLDVSESIYREFPELQEPIGKIRENSSSIKQLMGRMQAAFNQLLETNSKALNIQLKKLGVPYRFTVQEASREQHSATYRLQHVDNRNGEDMRDMLSTGEKNLVALLLFLYGSEGGTLLIDDPASSFDDFRRTQIYELIMASKAETVLVVSHDQAFIRRAVKDRSNARLGNIQAVFQKEGTTLIRDITEDKIVFLPNEIRSRIASSSSYLQIAINVRLLCDLYKEAVSKAAWGYVSMILHGYSRNDVWAELDKHGLNEEVVLEDLSQAFAISIPPMPEGDYFKDAELGGLSDFEKLILLRERYDFGSNPDGRLLREMLNDLVHMNDASAYCLSPYSFQTWSPVLNELLC